MKIMKTCSKNSVNYLIPRIKEYYEEKLSFPNLSLILYFEQRESKKKKLHEKYTQTQL